MSNKSNGNRFESEFCEKLAEYGFWAHNMAMNPAGQPADVIAVRDGRAYLIDCKDCKNGSFAKSRIEANQHMAMGLWEDCGNGSGWFAIQMNQKIYMVEIWRLNMTDRASVDCRWLEQNGYTLQQWVEVM